MTEDVKHEPSLNRYSLRLDGIDEPAVLTYEVRTEDSVEIYEFNHTYVPSEMRGKGVAGKLVSFAIEQARGSGHKVRPICTYVVRYMQRHPQDSDVLPEN